MKVKGSHTTTTRVEVDVEPVDAYKELKRLILTAHGFPVNAYVNNKNEIVVDEEYHTSHSWFEEKIINPKPTNDQLKIFEDLKNFAQQLELAIQIERKVR